MLKYISNPPCNGYPNGRPSYFALSLSYLEEHMMKDGVTVDDLRQPKINPISI